MMQRVAFLVFLAFGFSACATVQPGPDAMGPPPHAGAVPAPPPDSTATFAAALFEDLPPAEAELVRHHVYGAPPACPRLLVRQGYVNCFDPARRVPQWVAFRVEPDYRRTPPRTGRFQSFRTDTSLPDPVRTNDYTSSGYSRGHLAPYAVMGGDRDGDGQLAHLDPERSDPEDERTVLEANYMSNIAPQRGRAFNEAPGIWYRLERWIQDRLVDRHQKSLWVFAGTIFGPARFDAIGPRQDIEVPPLFYQVVVEHPDPALPPRVLAFLFPHHQSAHGDPEDFLVSVDVIEALTGLDFFSDLPDDAEDPLERGGLVDRLAGPLRRPLSRGGPG